jgi:hypothetical protein
MFAGHFHSPGRPLAFLMCGEHRERIDHIAICRKCELFPLVNCVLSDTCALCAYCLTQSRLRAMVPA